ncbi:MFS transporter [Paenarthrobacter sp. NCHU4564]|uniref:MFS transporter n=1 Tax=Paenarthrobacter sp. NCHU4564 TaxID=3451353 RepID=UPI003F98930A
MSPQQTSTDDGVSSVDIKSGELSRKGLSKEQRKSLTGLAFGNALEWFDGSIYATFAIYVAGSYFDKTDPTAGLLAALAIFAAGFIARPFGGIFFGWLADRLGRKRGLTLSVGLMALGLAGIAFTPSYSTIGLAAPVLLVLFRLLQGFSTGGETTTAQVFIAEIAPAARRGFWSSLIYISGTIGILCTVIVGAAMNSIFSAEQMQSWAWRIPFAIAAVLGLYTLWMRRNMQETEVYVDTSNAQPSAEVSLFAGAWMHRQALLKVIGLTVGFTTSYWAIMVNTATYGQVSLGYQRGETLVASAVGSIALIISLPFWGKLSDRIGRKPVLVIGFGMQALLFFPALQFMALGIVQLTIALTALAVFTGAAASIFPAVFSELFPTQMRATGVGIGYSLAVAIFGGTAPYLQQFFSAGGGLNLFPVYTIALLIISAITSLIIKETRGASLEEGSDQPGKETKATRVGY